MSTIQKCGFTFLVLAAMTLVQCNDDGTSPTKNSGGTTAAPKWSAEWAGVWEVERTSYYCDENPMGTYTDTLTICEGEPVRSLIDDDTECVVAYSSTKVSFDCEETSFEDYCGTTKYEINMEWQRSGNTIIGNEVFMMTTPNCPEQDYCENWTFTAKRIGGSAAECATLLAAPKSKNAGIAHMVRAGRSR